MCIRDRACPSQIDDGRLRGRRLQDFFPGAHGFDAALTHQQRPARPGAAGNTVRQETAVDDDTAIRLASTRAGLGLKRLFFHHLPEASSPPWGLRYASLSRRAASAMAFSLRYASSTGIGLVFEGANPQSGFSVIRSCPT